MAQILRGYGGADPLGVDASVRQQAEHSLRDVNGYNLELIDACFPGMKIKGNTRLSKTNPSEPFYTQNS